jgi:hypothetical protein
MSLSQEQAAAALQEITRAEKRSATLYAYQRSAGYLYMWGVIWVLGYGATFISPQHSGLVWGALVCVGVAAGVVIAALTLGGFFFIPRYFLLWMAAVGGGALMLAGFWMERP